MKTLLILILSFLFSCNFSLTSPEQDPIDTPMSYWDYKESANLELVVWDSTTITYHDSSLTTDQVSNLMTKSPSLAKSAGETWKQVNDMRCSKYRYINICLANEFKADPHWQVEDVKITETKSWKIDECLRKRSYQCVYSNIHIRFITINGQPAIKFYEKETNTEKIIITANYKNAKDDLFKLVKKYLSRENAAKVLDVVMKSPKGFFVPIIWYCDSGDPNNPDIMCMNKFLSTISTSTYKYPDISGSH